MYINAKNKKPKARKHSPDIPQSAGWHSDLRTLTLEHLLTDIVTSRAGRWDISVSHIQKTEKNCSIHVF